MTFDTKLSDTKIRWGLLILFGILSFIAMYYHEPWRDEYQTYLSSYYSHSLFDLYKNTAYDGHPKLWVFLVYCIKHISTSIFLIQVVHWSIALGTVYLLLFKSNIQKKFVYLIPFGYFFIYEYTAIFRNYAIGIFLIFLALTFYQSKKHLWFVIFLSISIWSSAYCFIIGCFLFLYFLIETRPQINKKLIAYFLFFCFNIIAVIYTTLPPSNTGYAAKTEWNNQTAKDAIDRYTTILFYYPDTKIDAWNSTWFSLFKGPDFNLILKAIASLLFVYFIIYFYRRSKNVALFYILGTLAIYLFSVIKFFGYIRHSGFYWIHLLVCIWIASNFQEHLTKKNNILNDLPIYLILIFHLAAGLFFIKHEYQFPFSQSQNVFNELQKRHLTQNNFIVDIDYKGSDFCALLKKPIFYANIQQYGTFTIWDTRSSNVNLNDSLIIKNFKDMKHSIYINCCPNSDSVLSHLEFIGEYKPCISGDENYNVYYVKN